MKNSLTTTQSTDLVLKKSKSMLNITNRILSGKTALTQIDESWVERLWAWADENNIPELTRQKYFIYEVFESIRTIIFEEFEINYHIDLTKNVMAVMRIGDAIESNINIVESFTIDLPFLAHYKNKKPIHFLRVFSISDIENMIKLNLLQESIFYGLPRNKKELFNLKILVIELQGLSSIAKELFNLINLEELNLRRNRLCRAGGNSSYNILDGINKLVNLKKLDIRYSSLSGLSDDLGSLLLLRNLILSDNQFMEKLPPTIINLKNLKEFNIKNNPNLILTQEQKEWIKELKENGCDVRIDIEDWIKELWDWADSNDIDSDIIPREKDLLLALETIDLSGLGLETLTSRLCFVEYVTTLILADNHIEELPKEIVNFRNLKLLNLKNNPLVLTPMQERWIEQLKEKGCEVYLGSDLVKSQHSDLVDESWIQRLWDWADENEVGDLEWIENKYFDGGGYYKGFPRDKKKLLELTLLDLIKNQLTELPKEIGNLSNLTGLGLGYNQLKELPKEIGNLSNLTTLETSNNEFTEFPKEIGNLSNLTELLLYENQLTELPEEIMNLSNLTMLDLKNNPNLILSLEQIEWIERLAHECFVTIDEDLFDRNINYDEIPF